MGPFLIFCVLFYKICKLITVVSSFDSNEFQNWNRTQCGKGTSEKNSLLENIFQIVQLQKGNGDMTGGMQYTFMFSEKFSCPVLFFFSFFYRLKKQKQKRNCIYLPLWPTWWTVVFLSERVDKELAFLFQIFKK